MEGLERLQSQVEELNDYNISNIWDYLKTRKELYKKFNNEEKSINQMYEYICDKASKVRKGNVAMVTDRVVYLWAMTYFNKTNEELGLYTKKLAPKKVEVKENIQDKPKKEENKIEDNQTSLFEEVQ